MTDILGVVANLQRRIEILERQANPTTFTELQQVLLGGDVALETTITYKQDTQPLGLNKSTDVGVIWLNTTNSALSWWDGYTWRTGTYPYGKYNDLRASAVALFVRSRATAKTFSQATAPTATGFGDYWKDTTTGTYKQWDGSTWVTITDQLIIGSLTAIQIPSTFYLQSTAPGAATIGDQWFDTTVGQDFRQYFWNGIGWESVDQRIIVGIDSDGQKPTYSPKPTVTGLVKSLLIAWPRVPNIDIVKYEVHLSTSDNFTPSASTFVGETAGTMLLVSALTNNAPLVENAMYYVRIVAKDNDGAAPVSPTVSGTLSKVGPNQIESISADQITTGNLLSAIAVVGSLTVGANIQINPDQGILISTSSGIIQFPANGQEATIQARLRTSDLVVSGGMRLLGSTNSVEGSLRLNNFIQPPKSAPSVTRDNSAYDRTYITQPPGISTIVRMESDGADWLFFSPGNDGTMKMIRMNKSTKAYTMSSVTVHSLWEDGAYGFTKIGTKVYTLEYVDAYTRRVVERSATTYAITDTWNVVVPVGGAGLGQVAIFSGGGDILIWATESVYNPSIVNRTYEAKLHRYGTDQVYKGTVSVGPVDANVFAFGLVQGNCDWGSPNYAISYCRRSIIDVRNYNDGSFDANKSWGIDPIGAGLCLTWDGTNFFGLTQKDGQLIITKYPTVPSNTYRSVSYTWYDSTVTGGSNSTHESTPSPATAYIQPARTYFRVDTPAPPYMGGPDDPNKVRIYIDNKRQDDMADGATSAIYSAPLTSGVAAPTTNQFGDISNPGQIESWQKDINGTPVILLKGDGTGRLGPFNWDGAGKSNYRQYPISRGIHDAINKNGNLPPNGAMYRVYTSYAWTIPEGATMAILKGCANGRASQNASNIWCMQGIFNGNESTGYIDQVRCHNEGDPSISLVGTLVACVDVTGRAGQTLLIGIDGSNDPLSGDWIITKMGSASITFLGMGG
jgi:hypothetical protein